MIESVFSDALKQLLSAVPGSRAAVFADWEGEMVDLALQGTDYDEDEARIRAAHWGIIYFMVREKLSEALCGAAESVLLNFSEEVVLVRAVDENYFVTLSVGQGANLGIALGAVEQARGQLREQM